MTFSLFVGHSSSTGYVPSPNIWCIFLSLLYIAVGAPYRPFTPLVVWKPLPPTQSLVYFLFVSLIVDGIFA